MAWTCASAPARPWRWWARTGAASPPWCATSTACCGRPRGGCCSTDGRPRRSAVAELAHHVGLCFQDPDRQVVLGQRAVRGGVRTAQPGRGRGGARAAVDDALGAVGLEQRERDQSVRPGLLAAQAARDRRRCWRWAPRWWCSMSRRRARTRGAWRVSRTSCAASPPRAARSSPSATTWRSWRSTSGGSWSCAPGPSCSTARQPRCSARRHGPRSRAPTSSHPTARMSALGRASDATPTVASVVEALRARAPAGGVAG